MKQPNLKTPNPLASKNSNELRSLWISDIHLGNNLTPTDHTLKSLDQMVFGNHENRLLDFIGIPGDLFDQSLAAGDPRFFLIVKWCTKFLKWARKHDVVVFLLAGTKSHDAEQSEILVKINDAGIGAELYYADDICVKHIARWGLDFLFVPDNKGTGDHVWKRVNTVLLEAGLERVHYAAMHGFFDFELPEAARKHHPEYHIRERYESIVKFAIVIGHHHTPQHRGKVWVPGSLERNKHGEEEPKGALLLKQISGKVTGVFVENTNAKIYRDFKCHGWSTQRVLELLEGLGDLPHNSSLRLQGYRDDEYVAGFKDLQKRFHRYVLKLATELREDAFERKLEEVALNFVPLELAPTNIVEHLGNRLQSRSYDPDLAARALRRLELHVNGSTSANGVS